MKKLLLLSFAALAAWMPAAAQSQVAGNYSGELYVTDASEIYNDDTKAADDQLLTVAANATAGKVDLTLPNFTYAGLPLGDIFLSAIGLQADGTLVRFAQETPQRLSLMGGAIVADTEIDGNRSYIKGDSLVAYISVTWLVDLNDPAQNVPIKVLFRGAKQSGSGSGDSETGSMADYHLANGTFDGEWVENKPWDSQNGYLVLEGKGFTQPEGWVVSNVSGINGLGATSIEELYILSNDVTEILKSKGIKVYKTFVGEYMTSLEMEGFSVSLLRLDDELKALLDAPADTIAFKA